MPPPLLSLHIQPQRLHERVIFRYKIHGDQSEKLNYADLQQLYKDVHNHAKVNYS